MIKIIKKLEVGEVPGGGGWNAEGNKQEVNIFLKHNVMTVDSRRKE